MHLSNFSLTDVSAHGQQIAFKAVGLEWDLHDYADFEGFDYSTTVNSSTLTLKWRIGERIIKWRDAGCQYGVPNYPANGFSLVFSNVDYLEILPRDVKMPRGEDLGISMVFCIEASEDSFRELGPTLYFAPCEETGPYHLVFQFNGGQMIRVGAEKAEFILSANE
jgi:hypothetical protein